MPSRINDFKGDMKVSVLIHSLKGRKLATSLAENIGRFVNSTKQMFDKRHNGFPHAYQPLKSSPTCSVSPQVSLQNTL